MLGSEELGRLGESTADLRFYQVGPNLLTASEISRITSPLRTLAWPHRDLMTNPEQMRRILLRQIGDRLARLRLKTGRHLLAGVTTQIEDGAERKILLLVLVPYGVESCDWQLSA